MEIWQIFNVIRNKHTNTHIYIYNYIHFDIHVPRQEQFHVFFSSMQTLDPQPGWHLQAPPRRRVEARPHLRLGSCDWSDAKLSGLIQIMSSIVHICDFLATDFSCMFLPEFDVSAINQIDTKQHALLCLAEACWPACLGKTSLKTKNNWEM